VNVAIIPARGGSKRIPRKNIKNFLGKPIIAYSIEVAKALSIFDKIIVSTDDEEIKEISMEYGAEVPFMRPSEISDDFTGTHEVIGHAVSELIRIGYDLDYVCSIYPTAPLVQSKDILQGYELIKNGDWENVFAATTFNYPIFRSFEKLESGGLKMLYPEYYSSRSQDLPVALHDAGQFYWAKPKTWIEKSKGYHLNATVILIPSWRVVDIDDLDDWKRAEQIYQNL
jgi:N-acylneuraminate cytidylyltransferase